MIFETTLERLRRLEQENRDLKTLAAVLVTRINQASPGANERDVDIPRAKLIAHEKTDIEVWKLDVPSTGGDWSIKVRVVTP